jgi:hypothetical protein
MQTTTRCRHAQPHYPLEKRQDQAHSPEMNAIDKTPPRWLLESLERSEAQIAAGQIVPMEPMLDRLRASIARMKAGQSEQTKDTAKTARPA